MVAKGGYKLIDFGGVDISTSKTISGIYNKIANTDKRIVGCNITLGTTKFKELTLDVKKDEDDYVLVNAVLEIVVDSENAVVGLAFTDENSSNKKLYFHPIIIDTHSETTYQKFIVSIIIIDNDENALNTKAKLLAKFRAIYNLVGESCRFPASGSIIIEGNTYPVYAVEAQVGGDYVYYYNNDGVSRCEKLSHYTSMDVIDGVNAIN